MNIRVFRQFLRIVELRNISKAASSLGLSQPTLTKVIRELEDELGTRLLYRDGHGVRPTENGKRFGRWANEIDDLVQRMRSDIVKEGDRLLVKDVSIGVLPSVARSMAAPLITSVREIYPNAEIRVLEGVSGHLIEWLSDQRLDIAIFYDNPAAHSFAPQPILTHSMCLVCSPATSELPAQVPFAYLKDKPLILASRQVGNRREFEAIAAKQKIPLKVVVEADSLPSMIRLVMDGWGYTILPLFAVQNEVAEGKLLASPIVDPTIERTLVMAAQNDPAHFAGISELIDDVRKNILAATAQ